MNQTALKIIIPLYNGTKGQIDKNFFSSDGTYDKRKVYWITPLQVYGPGGNSLYKTKIVPTRAKYEGKFTLKVWDKYLQAKPLLIAEINFDVDANTYEVMVTERYMCLRMSAQFNLMRAANGPHYTQAFRNQTPYGQWEFENNI
ncbi:hypothetical protein PHABIO_336 [Pseudomonas phage Phabio]|uniref:Virion structural protein n=1 Tax=Pseudomonas phage Phabio TaxID=2006668 RepID=A0A1Y0T287_9CAUD|nr:virion structural protein [Pseudomonas phage Phabio]ARV76967.1 hypothetical protein PHABIO_336 [Pseudomonas phage Phabio]